MNPQIKRCFSFHFPVGETPQSTSHRKLVKVEIFEIKYKFLIKHKNSTLTNFRLVLTKNVRRGNEKKTQRLGSRQKYYLHTRIFMSFEVCRVGARPHVILSKFLSHIEIFNIS